MFSFLMLCLHLPLKLLGNFIDTTCLRTKMFLNGSSTWVETEHHINSFFAIVHYFCFFKWLTSFKKNDVRVILQVWNKSFRSKNYKRIFFKNLFCKNIFRPKKNIKIFLWEKGLQEVFLSKKIFGKKCLILRNFFGKRNTLFLNFQQNCCKWLFMLIFQKFS